MKAYFYGFAKSFSCLSPLSFIDESLSKVEKKSRFSFNSGIKKTKETQRLKQHKCSVLAAECNATSVPSCNV